MSRYSNRNAHKCEFCGQRGSKKKLVDFHHYLPRKYRNGNQDGVYTCREFHEWVHKTIGNESLYRRFNDYEHMYELWELYMECD